MIDFCVFFFPPTPPGLSNIRIADSGKIKSSSGDFIFPSTCLKKIPSLVGAPVDRSGLVVEWFWGNNWLLITGFQATNWPN